MLREQNCIVLLLLSAIVSAHTPLLQSKPPPPFQSVNKIQGLCTVYSSAKNKESQPNEKSVQLYKGKAFPGSSLQQLISALSTKQKLREYHVYPTKSQSTEYKSTVRLLTDNFQISSYRCIFVLPIYSVITRTEAIRKTVSREIFIDIKVLNTPRTLEYGLVQNICAHFFLF